MPPHRISVVIPVRNEAATLDELAAAIRAQTRPPDEVIIVDGGSDDGTRERVRAIARADGRWRLVSAGPATPGRGRNVGARSATHEWLAFTDAGAWPEPSWLDALVRAADRDADAAAVYGNYEPITDTFFTRCAALAYVPGKQPRPGGAVRGPSTASMLVRRDVWDAVGGFADLRAGEDLLFFDAVRDAGHTVAWAPDATVHWRIQPTLAATFQRFRTYSRANVEGGLEARWHHAIRRQYIVALGVLALAAVHDWRWLLAVPVLFAARAIRRIWSRGGRSRARALVNPAVFAGVLVVTVVLDAATFAGWWDARARAKASEQRAT
jgi:glycosyltransferase involved in cell wall biosynthesis